MVKKRWRYVKLFSSDTVYRNVTDGQTDRRIFIKSPVSALRTQWQFFAFSSSNLTPVLLLVGDTVAIHDEEWYCDGVVCQQQLKISPAMTVNVGDAASLDCSSSVTSSDVSCDVIRRQLVTTAVLSRQLKVRQLVVDWSDLMTMTRLLHVLLVAHLQSYRALMWQYQPSSKFLYSILISDYVNVSIIAFAFMKTVTVNRPWRHVHCYNDVTFIVAMTSCSLLQWRHVHCCNDVTFIVALTSCSLLQWRHVHCYNDVTFIVAMTSCSLLQWRHVHCWHRN